MASFILKRGTSVPALVPVDISAEVQTRHASDCEEISTILDSLYIGSWRDAENPEMLRNKGITHILKVAKELRTPTTTSTPRFSQANIEVRFLPLADNHSEELLTYFDEAFNFIDSAIEQGGKVLVHCRRGISRSPAVVVGYLMYKRGYSFSNALEFVKERRRSTSLNLAFHVSLLEFEEECEAKKNVEFSESDGVSVDTMVSPWSALRRGSSTRGF